MRFPWQRNKELDEAVRKERGRLAKAIAENSVVRHRLDQRVQDGSVSSVLEGMFKRMDEGKGRG